MLRRVLFVFLTPLLALAGDGEDGKVVDKYSGLEINLPDGWERHSDKESRNRPLVAVYPVEQGRLVQFVAEVASADNYDADAWVASQQKNLGKLFEKLDNPLSIEERKLGGQDGIGFTLAGKKGDTAIRARVFHVVRNGVFFQFTEVSFADAHTAAGAEAIDGMWEGIAFGEATETIPLQEDADAGAGEARLVEDKLGNYKLTMPVGWELSNPPPTEAQSRVRVVLVRRDANGNGVAVFQVIRFESLNAETFTEDTPGDVIQGYINGKNLESVYGQNSTPHLTPDIDESVALGRAEKGGKWKISSITMKQKAERAEADNQIRKGVKGVEVPTFKPSITMGRCAMISPYLYHAWAQIRSDVAEDPKLIAEINAIFESFEFFKEKEMPPAVVMGALKPGNTMAAPELAKARKVEILHTATGRKVYKLGIKMTLPPGFRRLTKEEGGVNASLSAAIVAQDENNNWVKITIQHISGKQAGDENKVLGDKKQEFASWKSNWETKARGSKVPSKAKKVRWGKVSGVGYKELEGEIQNWPATFTGIVIDKSSWRTIIVVETQGQNAKRFEKELKKFFGSLKLNYKVK